MPIKVTCQCGQRFAAKDELAGKRVKCPKCGEVLMIGQAGPKPAPKREAPPAAAPAPAAAAAPADDYGLENLTSGNACPGCGATLTPEAVLCVACGYNVKSGQQVQTDVPAVDTSAAAGGPAQAPAAGSLGQRAASTPKSAGGDRRGWIVLETGLTVSTHSLAVGTVAFAIIAVMIMATASNPMAVFEVFGGGGAGTFVAMLLPWCFIALFASGISLVTGWFVCCGVPRSTNTRPFIIGALGCLGGVIALSLLMQLIIWMLTPSASDYTPMGQSTSMDTIIWVGKVFVWLIMAAEIAAFAAFGYFVGAVGTYLGKQTCQQLALGYCGLMGGLLVWFTALFYFILDHVQSAGMLKLLLAVTLILILVAYGYLLYFVQDVRKLVKART